MKYNINLNLLKMQEHGLNVNQWCILDIISTASTWCEIFTYRENHYYWVSKNKICEELKALDLKADTIYRHLKLLSELGFIDYVKDGKKDLVTLTDLGKTLFFKNSEINPTELGNKSELNSEINPTDNNTNIYNKTINNKEALIDIVNSIKTDLLNKSALMEWLEFKKYNYQKIGVDKLVKMLIEYSYENQQKIVDTSIRNNWKGLFDLKVETKPKQNNSNYMSMI